MLKVLIAEDELMIADLLEDALITSGYEVCGIARTVDEAVALAALHKPDLAILDVRLAQGNRGPDIARRLSGRATLGILYATGEDARRMQKLLDAIDRVADARNKRVPTGELNRWLAEVTAAHPPAVRPR